MSARLRLTIAAAGAALAAAACGTRDAPDPLAPRGPTGRVRWVNVITDTTRGRVNASDAGVSFGVNVTYATSCPACLPSPATALYSAAEAGARTLELRRTADTAAVVARLAYTLDAGQDRTVYAVGGAGGTAVTTFSTVDDNAAPAAGQARVRVVHLSPAAGAVDVFVTAPGADLAAATPAVAGLAVNTASAYLALAGGTYQVRVVPAGTAPAARAGAVVINGVGGANVALAAGAARTLVAADNSTGGAPLRLFALVDR